MRSMGRARTRSSPSSAVGSLRSASGVPLARLSGARSGCGVTAAGAIAERSGDPSGGMGNVSLPRRRIKFASFERRRQIPEDRQRVDSALTLLALADKSGLGFLCGRSRLTSTTARLFRLEADVRAAGRTMCSTRRSPHPVGVGNITSSVRGEDLTRIAGYGSTDQ